MIPCGQVYKCAVQLYSLPIKSFKKKHSTTSNQAFLGIINSKVPFIEEYDNLQVKQLDGITMIPISAHILITSYQDNLNFISALDVLLCVTQAPHYNESYPQAIEFPSICLHRAYRLLTFDKDCVLMVPMILTSLLQFY